MRNGLLRPLLFSLLAAAALSTGGCGRKADGVVQVGVIDGAPKLVDPARGPLTASEAVLIENAAQGLVRFDARGQIVPGLAETWNVSDDGLSYIFRLANGSWPDGTKITAEQVARMLRRLMASSSRDSLSDSFGAVEDVVAMTDRVIEIRLANPRPHLLQLLAQPEVGLVRNGQGTGPFSTNRQKDSAALRLTREIETIDEEQSELEQVHLSGQSADEAIRKFLSGDLDLVLGGTFADLPKVPRGSISRRALQFDPASGLFGLKPARAGGPVADPEVRQLLSQAIDRDALISALAVPGLVSRATVLEPGLDNIADPSPPAWAGIAVADRRADLAARAKDLLPDKASISVALPDGPGADILFDRLAQDWGVLGIAVKRAGPNEAADLKLVDQVAPSSSASWFVRHFRCATAKICDERVDDLLEGARNTGVLAQRSALLSEAAKQIDELQLFIPIAAPIRWSLASARITGIAGNRFAVHTLTSLEQRLDRTGE